MAVTKRIGRALSAKLTRVTLDRFILSHASNGRTLDLGAQNGPYASHFPRRVALDLRPASGVHVIGDAQALGLADASFDVVLCTEVLEHVPEPQRAVDEMFRVLKPGGRLLLTTRFLFPIHDAPHDYFRYTKYGLRHLFETNGFDVVEITALSGFWLTFGTLFVYNLHRLHRGPLRWIPIIPAIGLVVQGASWLLDRLDRTEQWTWMYGVVARAR